MEHKEYLDAVLRGADVTIIEAVRFNYYNDLLDILNRFERSYSPTFDCGIGWFPIIAQTNRKLAYVDPDYTVAQIKEKFGSLRYYYTPSEKFIETFSVVPSIMNDIVMIAEQKSSHTCEICSKQGSPVKNNGWYKTLCNDHI